MDYEAVDDFLLQHFGIKGMKWGVRRYQNEDGSLTPEGQRRYARMEKRASKNITKLPEEYLKDRSKRIKTENEYLRSRKESKELRKQLYNLEHPYSTAAKNVVNKVIIGSGTVAASALITKYAQNGFEEILKKIKWFKP